MTRLPDLNVLLQTYHLPPGFYIEPVDVNLYTVSGAGGEYILRIYPVGTSLDSQRYQHWLLTALDNRVGSFALPTPIRTRYGATFHTVENGSTWVLARRLRGSHLQPNDPDHAYAAGSALAELHTALSQIQPLPNPIYPHYDLYQRVLPQTYGKLPDNPADLGLQQTREAHHRLGRFIELARLHQQPPPLPADSLHWQIVHGDFTPENVLYDGEQVVGVLDFEYAHPDYRVREFADVLLRVASDLGSLFWGIARAYVDGYREHASLTRAEIKLVPEFLAARQVDRVLGYYRSGQPVHAAGALRTQEEISTWLEVEQSRLLAMLRGQFLGE